MQNHCNYTIDISWLVPGGCLQLVGGDKHKPEGLEGRRDSSRHGVGPGEQVQTLKGGLGHNQEPGGLMSAWFPHHKERRPPSPPQGYCSQCSSTVMCLDQGWANHPFMQGRAEVVVTGQGWGKGALGVENLFQGGDGGQQEARPCVSPGSKSPTPIPLSHSISLTKHKLKDKI